MKLVGRFPRILMSLFLALVLAAGVAAVSPHITHAAAQLSCSGTGCNGHDPYNYGCASDASVVVSQPMSWGTTNLGTAYVMWSSHCQTNWGRVVMNENHTDPACIILNDDQCWYRIEATMWLLGFDSSGHYDGQETYLPLSTDGPDYCDHNCGGSNIFYGNMYYAPTAEVMVKGKAYSENGDVFPEGCPYTGASWKYSSQQPVC